MFYRTTNDGYIESRKGIHRKTLVWGQESLLAEYILKKGNTLPRHKHPEEQVGYLVSGHVIFHINNVQYEVFPGDSWAIPGHIEHSADIIEDSVAIEIFSPVRKEYLPQPSTTE